MECVKSAVVFSGGPHPEVTAPSVFRASAAVDAAFVVAADSGLHLALACGRMPDLVIGDMDSVDPPLLDQARQAGAEIRPFPADKDATDLELALEAVMACEAHEIRNLTVIGSGSGRVDHLFGGLLLLAAERFANMRIDAFFDSTYVAIVRDSWEFSAEPGQVLSVMALNGTACGIVSRGLRWTFGGEALEPGSTRGVSNEILDSVAHISVESGVVAVILNQEREP
ncbi:unannotated protein [freshwater metagenome]|uniref:Unannotated protein n=1 Tax=freshwater metagenome TaxID=449393 RepID=A0A6J7FSV5_9ZZZZ